MTLFPDMTAADAAASKLDTVTAAADIGTSWRYDHEAGRFRMVDGSPEACAGKEAVREWIALMLRVWRGKNTVFDGIDAGVDVDSLLGTRQLPEGFRRAEIIREVRETLALCPAIADAWGFSVTREGRSMVIGFTCSLRSGETMEVSADVGG